MNERNVDGGDALFAVAAEITGEASMLRYASGDVPTGIKGRTEIMVGKLSAAIDAGADRRLEAKFKAALEHWLPIVGGTLTVRGDVAPVVREIRGELGDRFERTGEYQRGSMFEVIEIRDDGARSLACAVGHDWHADLSSLRDPSLFRFISSVADRAAAKVVIAAAGETQAKCAAWDGCGHRCDRSVGHAGAHMSDSPRAAWYENEPAEMAVVAPEEVVSDDGSDLDAPVGNLRTAAETLTETDAAIADLIRVWHGHKYSPSAWASDVQDVVETLADKAGLPVPWTRSE